ncbi:hydroxysqualene dehydroxylase [Stutzerimonas tarimensis]|uniref:FAD-dependent oxidoreductase n=1 Tax=Stutzerimonas tarimensis TaxID=1507735 RepID=A0ABV7SZJ2_9GAMM
MPSTTSDPTNCRSQAWLSKPDVVVVGAGIAGLCCAMLLAEAGLRVQVLEASEVPGGRARSWADPITGDAVDIGPHVMLRQYANMRALLERLGTAHLVYWQTDEWLRLQDRGQQLRFRLGPGPAPFNYLRSLPAILRAVPLRHLLSNIPLAWGMLAASDREIMALDDRTGLQYLLEAGVHRDFIDWFWGSAAIALLNLPVEQCSAASLMRLFAQALGHDDMAFGFPRVGLSDLYAWPAIRRIQNLGGEVRLDCAVAGLWRDGGRVAGVSLATGGRVEAQAVVLAVSPTAIPALLADTHGLAAVARRFEPSPYVSCYLWFDKHLGDARFWARPWSPEGFNTDFYDLANIRETRPGEGSLIASNIIWSDRVADLSDGQLVEATEREIGEFASLQHTRRVAASVHRIPMSIPCARPGCETMRPATRIEPGLLLAGDWVDTGLPFCMEGATRAGALAAEAVLAAQGRVASLALPPPVAGGLGALLRRLRGSGTKD